MTNQFSVPKRLSKEYEQAIRKWVQRVLLPKQPNETFAQWAARMQASEVSEVATYASDKLAGRMVSWVDALNSRDWRTAAAKAQQSRRLYKLLGVELQGATGRKFNELVRKNSEGIRSVPHKAAYILANEVSKAQQAGARPETIAKLVQRRFPQLLQSRINLLARTETAKASSELTQARSEELNLPVYIWRTSEDQRVRASHRKMDGVVVPWSQPPSPEQLVGEPSQGHYHAGQIYNCRCTQIVVLTIEEVQFPAKVYWHGSIKRMNRRQFQQLFSLETRQGVAA